MHAIYNLHCDETPKKPVYPQDEPLISGGSHEEVGMIQSLADVSNQPISLLNSLGKTLIYTTVAIGAFLLTTAYIIDSVSGIIEEQTHGQDHAHHGHYRSVHRGVCAGVMGGTTSGLFSGLALRTVNNVCNTIGVIAGDPRNLVQIGTLIGLVAGGIGGGCYGSLRYNNAWTNSISNLTTVTEQIVQ